MNSERRSKKIKFLGFLNHNLNDESDDKDLALLGGQPPTNRSTLITRMRSLPCGGFEDEVEEVGILGYRTYYSY